MREETTTAVDAVEEIQLEELDGLVLFPPEEPEEVEPPDGLKANEDDNKLHDDDDDDPHEDDKVDEEVDPDEGEFDEAGDEDVEEGEGVVLFDELDVRLVELLERMELLFFAFLCGLRFGRPGVAEEEGSEFALVCWVVTVTSATFLVVVVVDISQSDPE